MGHDETVADSVHGLHGVHIGQQLAKDPDAVQGVLIVQEIVPSGGGEDEVHSREDAFVGKVAVQLEFHIAGSLEFLEDDVVHLGAGFREGRGQDGEGTASFNVTGGTEETLGLLQGIGIHTTGENLAGSRLYGVVCTGQTCPSLLPDARPPGG